MGCPSCNQKERYYRVKNRRCFECANCGHQIYPTAGTPFEATRTSLRDWFVVMFMFCKSRNGVAAKEVERTIGCTYKTAHRMCKLIRGYMKFADSAGPLGGPGGGAVEADKAFIGGRDRRGHDDKIVVLGMIEREGNVVTRIIPDKSAANVIPPIMETVIPGSRVFTDEARALLELTWRGYRHESVNHHAGEYARGDVHTNNIEAFWGNVKRGIKGTYIHVSPKYLPLYLAEFEYRHNLRQRPELMFEVLLQAFPRP